MALNVTYQHQSKRVKVTPGTMMFQVLTNARHQFGLSDSLRSQLLHRGKAIDLSIPFRLTGISNNATIELVEIESAAEVQQARVCVQLPDGKRVQTSFNSDTTIERILTVLDVLPLSKERFSLEFLRREIDCDAFPTTTLKELGILSGSAMFRVRVARKTSDSAASSAPPSASPLQKPHISPASAASPCSAAPAPVLETSDCLPALQSDDHEMKAAVAEEKPVSGGSTRTSSYDALQMLRNNSFDAVSRTAVMTLMGIVTNILSDPENEKVRSIKVSNATFDRSIGRVKGGIEFLTSIGFRLVPETQVLVLSAGFLNEGLLEEGLRLLRIEADDLNIPQETRPAIREKKEDQSFDVFKPQITRVQMQPRGPSTTEVLVDALKSKQEKLVGYIKPPRSTTIAFGGKRSSGRLDSVLEDSERSDAQLLISSLKARRDKLEKTKNFRTQAMRDLDELERKRVFQTVLIRVQFPDRTVMQATFHPSETIQDVMDHVTECLTDQFRASKFYLYVTPPTQKLATSKTLIELNLVPAALTYLSWVEAPPASDVTSAGYHFRSDLLPDGHDESKESIMRLRLRHVTSQRCRHLQAHTQNPLRSRCGSNPSFRPRQVWTHLLVFLPSELLCHRQRSC